MLKWNKPKVVWHKHQNPETMKETHIEIGKHFRVYAEVYKPTTEFEDDHYVARVSFNTYIGEFGTVKKTMEEGIEWAEKLIGKELTQLHNALDKHLYNGKAY